MPHLRRPWICLAVATVVATACDDGQPLGPSLSGSVVTVVDSGPALKTAITFVLPDTVVELARSTFSLDHVHDDDIVAHVREHLVSMGWRDLGSDPVATPDVVVLIAASTRVQTTVVYSDWFGSWGYLPYWGGVDASWAWGAPVGAIPYEFPAGTLFVAMLDLRAKREADKTIPLLWGAAVDGVISNAATTAERALFGLDQAFVQSPYLNREAQ